jgi:hypothetical protein
MGYLTTSDPLRISQAYDGAESGRVANARPDPDLRYRSKRAAGDSSGNSTDITTDHGRFRRG